MARGLALGGLGVAAALAAAVALAALVSLGRGGDEPGARVAEVDVRASVQPRAHLFGDPVTAVVEVVLDRRAADPDSIRVTPSFPPYGVVGAPVVTRSQAGDAVSVRHAFTLFCLRADCRPAEGRRRFVLRPARVTYRLRDGTQRGTAVALPPVEAATRLDANDRLRPAYLLGDVPLPEPAWRVHPDRLGAGLLAAAALAGLAGLVLLGGEGRRVLAGVRTRRAARGTPLERALAAVRRAEAGGGPEERRLALDGLARAVDGADVPLSASIRSAAWSQEAPAGSELRRLADGVVAALGRRR